MQNESVKIDVSLGICLESREKHLKLQDRFEHNHPTIPQVKMGKEDKQALQMQKFRA